jgi:hypothetical protein
LALAVCLLLSEQASAETHFGPDVREAIVNHFQARLDSEQCARYFRFEGAQIANWTADDGTVRAEVVFFVSYVSEQALYRDSTLASYCLGAHRGTGFFERSKFYRSAALIYSLSRWSAGWHVDRVDVQP